MVQIPTAWKKTNITARRSWDKVWALTDLLGNNNRSSLGSNDKLGAEAFWPTSLHEESLKAARILRSFCRDGFYQEEMRSTSEGSSLRRENVLKKIPSQVVTDAKALAIFTTMRDGLWISGAGGSGVLVARTSDGTWSAPAGIMVHAAIDLTFLTGVDIYDCLVVINSQAALDAFLSTRCTLGDDVNNHVAIGPTDIRETVGDCDSDHRPRTQPPNWTYLKSHGFHASVPLDGTVVIERADENERFYGERISVGDILAGKARHPAAREIRALMETLRAAQGEEGLDERAIPKEAAPGDMLFDKPGRVFGIPESDDPDPYGVHALEMEGFEIREAGTRSRPSSEQFEYRPSPTSPIYQSYFHRRSTSSLNTRTREVCKRNSVDRAICRRKDSATQTQTQTVDEEPLKDLPEAAEDERHGPDRVTIRDGGIDGASSPSEESLCNVQGETYEDARGTEERDDPNGHHPAPDFDDVDIVDGSSIDELHEVHEEVRAQAASQKVISKARLVTIPRRIPPPLPPRSAARKKIVVNGERLPSSSSSSDGGHVGDAVTNNNTTTIMVTGHMPETNGWREVSLQTAS
ncbi:MAG: hypothetical protein M1816_007571 [Peltula sp. TS41687]|nr:MAG: hypothetical protein M1816_007571 [Peltula sp. TS41687]